MHAANLLLLAQDTPEGTGAGLVVVVILELALAVLTLAGMWTTFAKAGQPGWAAIIPIYNLVVWLKIVGRPIWWVLLFLIPCFQIIPLVIVCMDTARSFGQGVGFSIGLWLLSFIFWPMLGFGSAKYQGPAALKAV